MIEAVVIHDVSDRAGCDGQWEEFVQDLASNHRSLERRHPEMWNSSLVRVSLLEAFDDCFASPNSIVFLGHVLQWQLDVLDRQDNAGSLVALKPSFFRHIVNSGWYGLSPFSPEFPISFRKTSAESCVEFSELPPAAKQVGSLWRSVRHSSTVGLQSI